MSIERLVSRLLFFIPHCFIIRIFSFLQPILTFISICIPILIIFAHICLFSWLRDIGIQFHRHGFELLEQTAGKDFFPAGKDAVMFSRVVRLFLSRKTALTSRKGGNMLSSQSKPLMVHCELTGGDDGGNASSGRT